MRGWHTRRFVVRSDFFAVASRLFPLRGLDGAWRLVEDHGRRRVMDEGLSGSLLYTCFLSGVQRLLLDMARHALVRCRVEEHISGSLDRARLWLLASLGRLRRSLRRELLWGQLCLVR